MNRLKINSETGEVSIDDVEIPCVSDIRLNLNTGDFVTATIVMDCYLEGVLSVEGRIIWGQEIIKAPDNSKGTELKERIKSLISMLQGK